jgi:hypothetical protein
MNKKNHSGNNKCITFQERIQALFDNGVVPESDPTLEKHLNICPNCRNFFKSLQLIQKRMQKSPLDELKSRSQILSNTINFMKLRQKIEKDKKRTIWSKFKTLFEYRVPVYQALSGFAVLWFLFILISSIYLNPEKEGKSMDSSINVGHITTSDLYIVDSLRLLNIERGQNAKEDSVLIGFLVPSL